MILRTVAHELLPPRAQDWARRLMDTALPRRRDARRRAAAATDDLAVRVSPDGTVLGGPFQGMRLARSGAWGGAAARLAGTYECEIAPAVEQMVARRPVQVVDIGAAEGYYAVGLARRLPGTPVVAFDIDPQAQRACRSNAGLNGLGNVSVRGRATTSVLRRVIRPGALVVCDCEGLEDRLLDPREVPALRECDLIVELHEFANPGVTRRVTESFSDSHTLQVIPARGRGPDDPRALGHLDPVERLRAVDEGRPTDPPMAWTILTTKGR